MALCRRLRSSGWLVACSLLAVALPGLAAEQKGEIVPLAPHKVGAGVPIRKVDTKPMLLARAWPALVIEGGYLYIIGGLDGRPAALSLVERVDLKTGISRPFANLRKPRYGHQAFVHAGKLHVVGGLGFSGARRTAPLPGATTGEGAAYQWTEGAAPVLQTSVESIDLATGALADETPLPEGRSGFGLVTSAKSARVIAGTGGTRGNPQVTSAILEYDFATRAWSRAGRAPVIGAASLVRVGQGHIIAAGGYDGQQASDSIFAFTEATRSWKELPRLCQPVSSSAAAHLGNYLFFFGSYDSPDEIIIYNLLTKTSEALRLGYTPARSAAAIATERRIYVVGGKETKDARPNNQIQIFELVEKPQSR